MTTWPIIVGYRHEVLHTGVLHHLLCDEERAASVAGALAGAPVVRVLRSSVETRVSGFNGRADLVADVELGDGQTVSVGVETKVDSNASREQLVATSGPPHVGVLLSPGITAMNLTGRDLAPDMPAWNVITPDRWASVLRDNGIQHDELLAPYFAQVEREADEHARARELAHHPSGSSWSIEGSRRCDGLLEHYAWLAEIRERSDAPYEWWTYTNQSGPLMGLWCGKFQGSDRDVFVEFMCSDSSRRLCLKIGAGQDDLQATAAAALGGVEGHGWQPGRQPSKRAGTCTAGWLDFSDLAPAAAAARTRRAITEIAAG